MPNNQAWSQPSSTCVSEGRLTLNVRQKREYLCIFDLAI